MRISFFTIWFLLGLTFFSNDLCGQQTDYTYDTIQFIRHRYIGIGDYYSNIKILKGNHLSTLFKVSTQFQYLTQRNIKDGNLCSYLGLGADLSDGKYWLLKKDISEGKMNLNCKIEMYCRGIQNQITVGNMFDRGYNLGIELEEPILKWEKGAYGIIQIGEEILGQFQMTMEPQRMNDLNKWLKKVSGEDDNHRKELQKSDKDFVISCNFLNEEIKIIYDSHQNQIYLFKDVNLLGQFHPEKWKFLVRKCSEENPFLLMKQDLEENEQLKLLFLSMFSQWFMNVIRIY